MSRTFVLVLAALAITLALLIWNHDSGTTAGLANDDFAGLVMLGTLLATLIAGGAWYRGTLRGSLRDIALWLAIFGLLGLLYQASPALQAFMAR
jgi:aspartyl protease family protein